VLAGVGVALGAVLTLLAKLGSASPSKVRSATLLILRLAVFALVVGWSARAFGPASGLTVLASAILVRGLLVRRSLMVASERPKE
jgi:hypothetical protein